MGFANRLRNSSACQSLHDADKPPAKNRSDGSGKQRLSSSPIIPASPLRKLSSSSSSNLTDVSTPGSTTSEQKRRSLRNLTSRLSLVSLEEGGSGVPLSHDAYKASVAFWAEHAIVS